MNNIKTQIRKFIIDNFMFGNSNEVQDDTSFLDEGIIDSTGVLELITFIEKTFPVKVDDEDLIPENFDSLDKIVAYLQRKGVQSVEAA